MHESHLLFLGCKSRKSGGPVDHEAKLLGEVQVLIIGVTLLASRLLASPTALENRCFFPRLWHGIRREALLCVSMETNQQRLTSKSCYW
jgi:hypothetical protein